MANLALAFDITARDKASSVFRQVGDNADRTGRKVGDAGEHGGKRLGSGISSGVKIAAGALAGLGAINFLKGTISAASDLGETTSKVGVLFGDAAAEIESFASGAAASLGQSKQQAMDAAATFATFGRSAGLTGGELSDFSTDFVSLASDLASFNNTSPEEAIDAIGSALRGEAEPLRKYGVLLDDASMRQAALKKGLIKTTKEALTPQQKVLAAQALIFEQTGAAQGDFARTSEGLANKQRILAAQFANIRAELGQKLLPVALDVATFINDRMLPVFSQLYDIIFKGDFTGGPFAEDSWFVGALFAARDAFITLKDFAVQAFDILFRGDYTGGPLQEDSWFVSVLFTIRDTVGTIRDAAVQMFDVLFRGDFTGGPLQEDSWLIAVLFGIRDAIAEVVAKFRDDIIPAVQEFIAESDERLKPALTFTRDLLDEITENLRENSDGYRELKDSVLELIEAFDAKDFRGLLLVVGVGLKVWAETLKTINEALNLMADLIAKVVDAAADMKNLSDIILPEVGGDILSGAGGVLSDAGSAVGSLFGGWRADGGPVTAGRAYIVGERGPELLVPSQSGTVVPNHQLPSRLHPDDIGALAAAISSGVGGAITGMGPAVRLNARTRVG